jgi:hypothetical protein
MKVINIHKFLSRFVEKPKRELQNNITNPVDSEEPFFRMSIAEKWQEQSKLIPRNWINVQ